MKIARVPLSKRIFDLTVTVVGMVVALPVMALIALLVKAKIGSPVFFTQDRPGLNEKPFRMMKFRTMREAYDAEGNPLPDADRMTKVGKWLRATSLDELPELFCVLKGEMSLVGPRPLLMSYLGRYSEEQRRRHQVLPGITGWAQIHGRNALHWEDKFALDLWYVDHQSFWLDLRILLLTVVKVFKREGISADGHVTMEEFKGN